VKFHCIADEDTVRGFRLAGVAGESVDTPAQAASAVARAAAQAGCGVIVLTQNVAAGIRRQIETMRLERDRPLIVEIPGPEGPMPGRKSLRQSVQEAVGIRIGQ
jgi:V/A-type H+-transporting ATPase subunit F